MTDATYTVLAQRMGDIAEDRICSNAQELLIDPVVAEDGRVHERAATYTALAQRVNDISDDLICPITQELPIEPVVAEDGRIYERAAILQWINRQGALLRSPMTNEAMGPQLHPAIQVRNTIMKLVQSGVICADAVARFTKRLKDAEEVRAMRTRAENGDDHAMLHLAVWYQYGLKGLPQLPSDCFHWFQRAAEAGNPRGIACAGECYISGEGVPQQEAYGLHLMTMAAERGSEAGAFCLGLWYAEGLRGLPVNIEQSKYWLGKVVDRTCAYPGLSTDARDLADALLDELAHPESGREDDLLDSCGELFRNGESEGQEAEASFNSMNVEDVVASAFVYDA